MTKKQTTIIQEPSIITNSSDVEISSLKERLARSVADYHNLEARYSRESGNMIKYANSSILEKLLEVRDHLGLAAAAGDKSLSMIMSSFDKILTDEGVITIATTGAFDPTIMECQEQVAGKEGEVVTTVRLGYKLFDRVLRPARVIVGNGVAPKDSP
ncbi:MAG: nucleotide exchange factor GrpE [bacterium]